MSSITYGWPPMMPDFARITPDAHAIDNAAIFAIIAAD
jgi:hypothetical protein